MTAARTARTVTATGSRATANAERDGDRGGESDADGEEAAVAVGEAAEQRIDGRLEQAGGEEDGADRDRAPACGVEPERDEQRQEAEEEGGERVEPQPADEAAVPEGAAVRGTGLGLASGCPARACPRRECERDEPDGAERGPDADLLGDRAEHRPDDRAEHSGAEGDADQLASPARAGDSTVSQARAPAQVIVLEKPWTKRASSERPRPVGGGEGEAREREEHEPGENGELRPVAGGREPTRDAAEQRAGAEGADEEPGAGLREPELVRVPGHERPERTEQHRVDEDDRADENQQRRIPRR